MAITVLGNVGYHLSQKFTAINAPPLAALLVTYFVAFWACLGIWLVGFRHDGVIESLRLVNIWSIVLGVSIIFLELGYLLAYRSGWSVGLAAIVSNVAVSLVLIPIALLWFKDTLTPTNGIGVLFSLAGLWLMSRH